ncbi:hypothetical protein BOTBODRAFT_432979 [Botryobasidium botryosum FD-172 SS1]|uniref:Uncharacterized protein n=1 Tax=Botryobasidium botryosum (strain FD-172 SS1) TaxID=930990 RepID=A0A067MUC3_BOTB1|nr:hypothetical protein BOTBODRAFT_432979 [Botryobasidium botryosum FD-172 SS1]
MSDRVFQRIFKTSSLWFAPRCNAPDSFPNPCVCRSSQAIRVFKDQYHGFTVFLFFFFLSYLI